MRSDDRQAGCSVQTCERAAKDRFAESVKTEIVLFGGTFDPPHIGHLTLAQLAYEQTGAKEVWFIPAPTPPHKLNENIHTLDHRTQMVESLVASYAHLKVVPLENRLPEPSYTVDTIRACKEWFPQLHFRLLIGGDSLCHLPSWHEAEQLVQMVEFLVAARTDYPFEETLCRISEILPGIRARRIEMPILDISSTWIRERLYHGLPVCGLLPESVLQIWMGQVGTSQK